MVMRCLFPGSFQFLYRIEIDLVDVILFLLFYCNDFKKPGLWEKEAKKKGQEAQIQQYCGKNADLEI